MNAIAINKIDKILFTGKTHTIVSRGTTAGDHGNVDLQLSSPSGPGLDFAAVVPHPTAEQLFAGAWSACYITALEFAAAQKRVKLPEDVSVDIEIDLGQGGNAWFLQARFDVRMPGMAQDVAEKIAHIGHEICPYSKATKGNIDVAVTVTI
jgi:Ohr subfamily peroxiredoxin